MSWSCSGIVPSALGPILSRDCHFWPQHQLNFVAIPYWSCRLDPGYNTKNYRHYGIHLPRKGLRLSVASPLHLNDSWAKGGILICNKQPGDPLVLLVIIISQKAHQVGTETLMLRIHQSKYRSSGFGGPPVHRFATANLQEFFAWIRLGSRIKMIMALSAGQ